MMEASCAVLDIKIITTLERDDDIDEPVLKPAGFDTYVAMLKQVETLQCEAKELQEEAKTLADSVEKALLADDDCDNDDDDDDNSEDDGRPPLMTLGKVKKAQEKVQELSEEADRKISEATDVKAKLPKQCGFVVCGIDQALQSFGVGRHSYHGQAFIDNHVNKCCKEENIQTCKSVIRTTARICPQLNEQAAHICGLYKPIFSKFAACHNL
ncbi:uncharacterized protein [Ptychodera flava]|uniref:uncharacterized protein isoform X1 n=2 Tax=Ptychodera flava TaxID=63121 RepID=UPI003969EFE1